MSFDLTGQKISETFQRVVQYDSSSLRFLDGLGNPVAVTASVASSSHTLYADAAGIATILYPSAHTRF